MGEIIASLDGYFYSPGHNFDWKHAGVSREFRRARDPRGANGDEGIPFPALAMTTTPQDLQRSRLPLQSHD
jgi:hypothetical protein